ncbi:nuclear transport factor 2 family protein [uncultured Microbulbifer sp.]|uniref:nuclear transport factor 2 family protein n=1 Tax=uncultured Microbulbifer sp. TaxID=348147 RepID=UPI00260856F1|nr:nuclear transport factor 2 family protein [uncultured Microbulbifer sp.]
MRILISALLLLASQISFASSNDAKFDYEEFANEYFEVWTTTQSPDATNEDIENYLSLLADNVGHQHFPYDPEDYRDPEGKAKMRKGMLHYLGGHKTYKAKLLDITYGVNAIVIKYGAEATYVNPQGEPAS